MPRFTTAPRRSISFALATVALSVALTACGSEGSVVYVDDVVTPTTAPSVVVPATTTTPPLTVPGS